MNLKKNTLFGLLILTLFAIAILTSCGGNDMRPEKALGKFSKEIENENLVKLSLTIYYMNPSTFTPFPLSVDDVISGNYEHKIEIDGTRLAKHIELIKQINNNPLTPVKEKSRINARIYYVFENIKGQKIFDVAMWGETDSIFINGVEVDGHRIFCDAIMPFLPEDATQELENLMAVIWPS